VFLIKKLKNTLKRFLHVWSYLHDGGDVVGSCLGSWWWHVSCRCG